MNLKQYFDILWRRRWVIIFTVAATMVAVVTSTRAQTPMYRASATLRIAASAGGTLNYSEYVYAAQLMNTYVAIATSRPILDELKTQLNLNSLPAVIAEVIPNTELVKIVVVSADPKIAATAANTLADILITDSKELYIGGGVTSQELLGEQLIMAQSELNQARDEYAKLISQTPVPVTTGEIDTVRTGEIETARQLLQLKQNTYTTLLGQFTQASLREEIRASMITVVEPAVVPLGPFEPQIPLNYTLGVVVGLIGGLGLAFILENLDTSLYKSEDIESAVEINAIARIPKANRRQLSAYQNEFSPFADSFQNLAINLQPSANRSSKKVLLVMSAEPNQGKSMIVHRLAISLSELGNKVVVVDCDVRLPKLHTLFNLANDCGLTDVLERKINLKDALQVSMEDVTLIASGTPSTHPPKLLGSAQMVNLIAGLKREFDYVLLDTPALLAGADITAVVPNVDSVLLVARRGYARREALRSVKRILAGFRFREKPVDLIINQAELSERYNHYQYRKKMSTKVVPNGIKPV